LRLLFLGFFFFSYLGLGLSLAALGAKNGLEFALNCRPLEKEFPILSVG
jgi:hypothetical protein